jgi:hypothetical protein
MKNREKIVGNTVVRRLDVATLQLDTLSLHLSTTDSTADSTVPDSSTPEESDDDLVLQHRVTSSAGGSLRLHGRLAHPDSKLNPEAPSVWSFSLRRKDDSSLSVEKGMVGKIPV